MSRVKNLFLTGVQQFFKSRKLTAQTKVVYVGKDHLGNYYYEADRPNAPRRHQRYFERKELGDATAIVDLSKVPPAWDAWLRFRRRDPPTEEEILESDEYFATQQTMAKMNSQDKKSEQASDQDQSKSLKKRPFPKLNVDQFPKQP